MGGVVKAVLGGGSKPKGDGGMAEMQRQNVEQQKKLDAQKAQMDEKDRIRAEEESAKRRARRAGGSRALMSATRLNPESGLPGEAQSTLGPK